MKILVYGINYYPELTGIGKYTAEMCEWLAKRGHQVEVITGMPYYPDWEIKEEYKGRWWFTETIEGVKVHRAPLFVTSHVTTLTRIIQEITFFLSTGFFWIAAMFRKYDVILSVYPPLVIGIYPLIYRLFHKSEWIIHVQDLQVDAAKELGLIKNKKLLSLFFKTEKFLLPKASKVSGISEGIKNRLFLKGVKKENYIHLPNWVDVDFLKPLPKEQSLKQEMGFKPDDKIILYSGNLGEKQVLEIILNVAKRLKYRKDIYFLIAGEGAYKRRLKKLKEAGKLENVVFTGLKPYNQLPAFLNMADLHLVIAKKGTGDLVLPSKINSILAVGGVAIVSATENTTLYNVINTHEIGMVVEPESDDSLLSAIDYLIDSPNLSLKNNARKFAVERLSVTNVLSTFENNLQATVAGN